MNNVSITSLDINPGLSSAPTFPVLPPPVIRVALNMSEYNVTEGKENPTICAEIQDPDPDKVMCPVNFKFRLALNSVTNTAGEESDKSLQ